MAKIKLPGLVLLYASISAAFICQGALSVKFGSAMEVEIDGEVQTFANGDVWTTPTNVPCLYKMRPVLAAGERTFSVEGNEDVGGAAYRFPQYGDDNWVRVSLSGDTQVTLTGRKVSKVYYADAEHGNDDWDGTADYEHRDETATPKKGPKKTLQAAHDSAAAGSGATGFPIVLVAPGVYDEGVTNTYSSGTSDLSVRRLFINKSIGFIATQGPEHTFLVGAPDPSTGGKGPNAVAGVRFSVDGRAFLQGFTITGCYSPTSASNYSQYGTAFCGVSKRAYALDCVISNNVAHKCVVAYSGYFLRTRIFENTTHLYLFQYGTFSSCVFARNVITYGNTTEGASALGDEGALRFCTVDLTSDGSPSTGRARLDNKMHVYGTLVYGLTDKSTVSDTYWHDSMACDSPVFANPASFDYRIGTLSPSIDAASYSDGLDDNSRKLMTSDIDGRMPVVHDGMVRLGAVWNEPTLPVTVLDANAGMSISGASAGTNVVLSANEITLTATDRTRPFIGFEVNGEIATRDASYTFTPSAEGEGVTEVKAVYGSDWYVDCVNGDDANGGGSLANAKRTIRAATTNAADGAVIHVAPGTYGDAEESQKIGLVGSRVVLPAGVTLESTRGPDVTFIVGGAATGDQIDNATYGTGTNAVRCVYAKNRAVVRGFTLVDGRVAGVDAASPNAGGQNSLGSAFYSETAQGATLAECVVSNNVGFMGTIYNAVVDRCTVLGNVTLRAADASGSGGYKCKWYGSIIDYNRGGGQLRDSVAVESCTIGANNLTLAGGTDPQSLYWYTSDARSMVNTAVLGGRFYYDSWDKKGKLYCTNCLVFADKAGTVVVPERSYNCIFTNIMAAQVDLKYRPILGSFAGIEKGDALVASAALGDKDVLGTPRILNGAMDIGAVEYDWRPTFARALGRRFEMTYASPSVTTNAAGGLLLGVGGGFVETALPCIAGKVGKAELYEFRFQLPSGSVSVYVGGELVGTESGSGAKAIKFDVRDKSSEIRLVYAPDELSPEPALITKFVASRGMIIKFM